MKYSEFMGPKTEAPQIGEKTIWFHGFGIGSRRETVVERIISIRVSQRHLEDGPNPQDWDDASPVHEERFIADGEVGVAVHEGETYYIRALPERTKWSYGFPEVRPREFLAIHAGNSGIQILDSE